ncbi:MAG: IS1/IS1595 family N-terminal zinc-binding domain-containing protein, partial [Waterburya sp.]
MQCPGCPKELASRRKLEHIRKNGKNRQGKQNYVCVSCPKGLGGFFVRILLQKTRR